VLSIDGSAALKRTRNALIAQLKALAQDEKYQAEISGFEARLAYAREDANACRRKLAAVQQQLAHIRHEGEQLEPQLRQVRDQLATIEAQIQAQYPAIHAVEDRLFADFCAEIGVENIREYEQGQLALSQQANEKRLQFSIQRSKLENL
jgi:structural maintenance of chromosome 1